MSDQSHPSDDSLSPSQLQHIDEVRDRFENAWQNGQQPRIEDYLGTTPGPERRHLFRELLLLDLALRCQPDEAPRLEEYQQRFREYAELIEAVFQARLASSEPSTTNGLSPVNDIFLTPIGDHHKRFDIPPGETTVGRGADSGILLSSPSVSRRHALFQRDGWRVWLTDLNSTNGTYVNDERMDSNQRIMLYLGDQITFGCHLPGVPDAEFVIHGIRMSEPMLEDDPPSTSDVVRSVPPAAQRSPPATRSHVGFRPPMEHDYNVGELIEDRWEVQQVLHGGMGIVYVVLDRETGQRLAAKTYRDDLLTASPDLARRFEREALAWINLGSHPNIVQAKYVRTLHHKPFLFLEFIEGGSLGALIPSLCIGEFPDGDETNYFGDYDLFHKSLKIQALAMKFCSGMIHASQFGIRAHRDIKADNCLVGLGEWDLKITDFGLANIFDDSVAGADMPSVVNVATGEACRADSPPGETVYAARVPDRLSIFVTRTGALAGTPSHMAPEQFDGIRHLGVRADIYSFGVMLFQLITGRLPFTAKTWLGYRHRHQNVMAPEVNLGYFTHIVRRCLAKNPYARYASFLELFEALRGSVWDPEKTTVERWGESPSPAIELTDDELVRKGLSLAELGRYSLALATFNHIIERNPRCAKAWREKGNLLIKVRRDFPEALESLKRAKQLGELGLEEQIAFCRDQLL
jgi:serine/threonine protein kinase/pSer/pThr/pTyr-binding forkhead associated (FHA) protein